jgi:hypothetical protein
MKPGTPPPRSGAAILVEPKPLLPSPWAHAIHRPVFLAFLLSFLFAGGKLVVGRPTDWPGIDAWFWSCAAATTLVGLARRLPEQNVLLSAVIIAAMSFLVAVAGDRTAIPFGPRVHTDQLGRRILGIP